MLQGRKGSIASSDEKERLYIYHEGKDVKIRCGWEWLAGRKEGGGRQLFILC